MDFSSAILCICKLYVLAVILIHESKALVCTKGTGYMETRGGHVTESWNNETCSDSKESTPMCVRIKANVFAGNTRIKINFINRSIWSLHAS